MLWLQSKEVCIELEQILPPKSSKILLLSNATICLYIFTTLSLLQSNEFLIIMSGKHTLCECRKIQNKRISPSIGNKLIDKRDIQPRAFQELLELRYYKNGGNKIHGEICQIITCMKNLVTVIW